MELSQKHKAFFSIFLCIFEIYIKLWTFSTKIMMLSADVFPQLRTRKNLIRYMSEKSIFRGPFDRQHVKQAQTLLQPGRQHRYHI